MLVKWFEKFENFDKVSAALVNFKALNGDGIQMWESGLQRKDHVCKYYKDQEVGYEMRWQEGDIFAENQWSEFIESVGNQGTLLPFTNSTSAYKSLLDDEGVGILCPYDEIWMGAYWFGLGPTTNHQCLFAEIQFRPRQISRSDLMMMLIKRQCNRPCSQEPTLKDWPCVGTCHLKPNINELPPDEEIELPNGVKVKAKDYFKTNEERGEIDLNKCIVICNEGGGGNKVCKPKENTGFFMYPENWTTPESDNCVANNFNFFKDVLSKISNNIVTTLFTVLNNDIDSAGTLLRDSSDINKNQELSEDYFNPSNNDNALRNISVWIGNLDKYWGGAPAADCKIQLAFANYPKKEGDKYLYASFGLGGPQNGKVLVSTSWQNAMLSLKLNEFQKFVYNNYNVRYKNISLQKMENDLNNPPENSEKSSKDPKAPSDLSEPSRDQSDPMEADDDPPESSQA